MGGADAPIAAMKDAIDEGLDDCEEGNDDDDYPFCETAVTCAALNGVTAHWKWLHLIDSKCQKIMNQFNGGRNKKNFNPEDKKALKTAKEEVRRTFFRRSLPSK